MKADEIRSTYLTFFEERGHKIVPSAALVPAAHDPSVLLTTAGMQPLKPYFLGREQPPRARRSRSAWLGAGQHEGRLAVDLPGSVSRLNAAVRCALNVDWTIGSDDFTLAYPTQE